MYFGAEPGNPRATRDFARVQTTTGALIMRLEPPKGLAGRRAAEEVELAKDFEDNARLAAAGKDTFKALKKLLDAALAAGIDPDSPAVKEALGAITKADPPRFEVHHEGSDQPMFEGTNDECHYFLMRIQGQSTHFATAFGGFSIEPKRFAPQQEQEMEAGPAPAM